MNTNKFYSRLSEEVMILLQVKRSKVCLEMPVDLLMICLSKEVKEEELEQMGLEGMLAKEDRVERA
jgi:pantothenate kinase